MKQTKLVVLVCFFLAFTGAALAESPQVQSGGTPAIARPTGTAAEALIMDEAHFAKLKGFVERLAKGADMDPKTSRLLGLTAAGEHYLSRAIGFTRDEVRHSFGIGTDDPAVLIFIRQTDQGFRAYRARKDGRIKLILGIKWEKGVVDPALVTAEEALAGLDAELKIWVDELDKN